MSRDIPLSIPCLAGNEWKYIKDCLDTGWVSSAGSYVDLFEQKCCEFTGSSYAVACINGTSALQTALRIVGVRPGDEVIVPTITFIAPVNAVRYMNAEPVFMDCDDFYNLDVDKTLKFIETETVFKDGSTFDKGNGRRISAVIPVHVFGNAVDLTALLEPCNSRGIKIVEDATESLGTYYLKAELKSRHTGTIGDIGCYSFNGNKIITTGGGGMIVTNNEEYAEKARYLTTQAKDDPVRYIHNEIGYNFRLSNIQAAMGVAQFESLPEFLKIKKKNYESYKKGFALVAGLKIADTPAYSESNHWFYCLQIERNAFGMNRDELMDHLSRRGVQTRPIWQLNHLQEPYRDCRRYRIEKAPEMLDRTLNIPCSVDLDENDIQTVIRMCEK
jgi:perosamine synthetase